MKAAARYLLLFIMLTSCAIRVPEEGVTDFVSRHAHPLKTVLPGSPAADLRPIRDIVGDARIVALGEPTHGNREVFLLKHRLIEYLVTELDFNVFALECPLGEAYDINRYVVEGIGDPEKALAGIYYWIWDTEEVLGLIKWMRSYNADPAHKTKVKFYGFDTQDPERAARVMLDYLAKVDPDLEQDVRPELGILAVPFSNPEIIGRRQFIPTEYDSLSLLEIRRVMEAFDQNKAEYLAASGEDEWTFARQHARQVEMYVEANSNEGKNYTRIRDRGQAENLAWILEQEGSNARMMVWAHNSHVSNSSRWRTEWMGTHLKRRYGDKLRIFGFFFNRGQFRALDEGVPSGGMHDFSVGPAPEGTFEHLMATTRNEVAVLDLGDLPSQGTVFDWFDQERPTRSSGGGFNDAEPDSYLWPYNLASAFDVLVYVDSTTTVRPVDESDYDYVWLLDRKLDKPGNTGFEHNRPGEAPDGWVTWSKFKRLGAEMEVSDERPYRGKNSARLHLPAGPKYGEIAPSIRQYIDAAPYRGHTLRLRMAARAELADSDVAYIRLAIDPKALDDAHEGLPPLYDSLDEYRIESPDWRLYTIDVEVPDDAHMIHYGIYLQHFGTAWMDDVQVEIVD
ncbi:erythromycin esterase [Lewinella marina]|uniref:Erythromycin esterase n=1 Tax=Neolewinella marina TaxID=438751 RepID=A0A2G0CKH4_9BACT|nr:erythromycin esterase family protein [Neolewinella marina]NJB84319.1 erythromycin esterase [Neolewinella marina]PHL00480.1 hypothetical protein CGL56_05465 [Neolewinella marina]